MGESKEEKISVIVSWNSSKDGFTLDFRDKRPRYAL